jgi:hypothetical protein
MVDPLNFKSLMKVVPCSGFVGMEDCSLGDARPDKTRSLAFCSKDRTKVGAACNMGLEGLVSKHRDRPYRAGRSPHWIKVKNPASPAMTRAKDIDWSR